MAARTGLREAPGARAPPGPAGMQRGAGQRSSRQQCTHERTHPCWRTLTHSHAQHAPTLVHAHAHTLTLAHMHTRSHTHALTHSCTHACTHARTHAHNHAHTHSACTLTHTHSARTPARTWAPRCRGHHRGVTLPRSACSERRGLGGFRHVLARIDGGCGGSQVPPDGRTQACARWGALQPPRGAGAQWGTL